MLSKKLVFSFFVFVICLVFLFFQKQNFSFNDFCLFFNGKKFYFTSDEEENGKYAGLYFISKQFQNQNDVKSEFCVCKNLSILDVKNFFNAEIVGIEQVENKKIYYLKTNLLTKKIKTEIKTFNLQVIVGENLEVFYPINFGSF